MEGYFKTRDLCVGYHGKVLIRDIQVEIEKGKILTLIGPNGAGKSTILKSITRHLKPIGGQVTMGSQEISQWSPRDMAKQVAVVLTERIRPELMTCAEVVAMGRYPYTNLLGHLTKEDEQKVREALEMVHAMEIADQDFMTLSDGQRQRILLARAICQDPEVMVLDEPTAYLDIRHKVELLEILRKMARDKGITVIMSLHEIDLATKISDYLLLIRGETIQGFGPPETLLKQDTIEKLYDLQSGSYNLLFGSVELAKAQGEPTTFVVAGGGYGIPVYRALQRKAVSFATGVLYENDLDYPVARELSDHVVGAPAFAPMEESRFSLAEQLLLKCTKVIDAGTPIGPYNRFNARLLELARENRIPILPPEAVF